MKIKLLTSLATAAATYARGEVVEWPDADAIRLIEAEFAVPVVDPAERAVKPPAPEKRGHRGRR